MTLGCGSSFKLHCQPWEGFFSGLGWRQFVPVWLNQLVLPKSQPVPKIACLKHCCWQVSLLVSPVPFPRSKLGSWAFPACSASDGKSPIPYGDGRRGTLCQPHCWSHCVGLQLLGWGGWEPHFLYDWVMLNCKLLWNRSRRMVQVRRNL